MEFKEIKMPFSLARSVLALGSQNKNTVCFAKGKSVFISGTHSNLSDPDELSCFERIVKYFLKNGPKVIACDLHPEYNSSKFAFEVSKCQGIKVSEIQHHHAHIASCMADNGLVNQKVIGVAFDGTGLGSDGTLWGAEFLISDYRNFYRAAHLKEIALIGAEKAILEPWRLLAGLGLARPDSVNKNDWQTVKKLYSKDFNSPYASSMGRLFDAAACVILDKPRAGFEAGLAIELEHTAISFQPSAFSHQLSANSYKYKIIKNKDKFVVDPIPIFKDIIRDLQKKEPKAKIAYRFHLTVADIISKICKLLRKKYKINKVVLSCVVFQNNLLLRLSLGLLYKEGFKVFIHKDLSCNDSGISLGQAVIAGIR